MSLESEAIAPDSTYSSSRCRLTHGQVADVLGITSGSVTALVDRLVDAGYVRRRPSDIDRRRIEIELTPRTYNAFASVDRPCGDAVAHSLSRLADRERHAASTALSLATDAITQASGHLRAHG